MGASAAMKLLEWSLFSITIGSNDFINNYLIPLVSPVEETFVEALILRLRLQLTVKLPCYCIIIIKGIQPNMFGFVMKFLYLI